MLVTVAILCSLARLLVLKSFGQTVSNRTLDEPTARLWERRYATSSILMSIATGAIGARCFLGSDILVHMFAAGLMCGCGAGVVTRLSASPRLAIVSLCCICIPSTVAAFLNPDIVHFGLAILFFSFLVGSLEAIKYLFNTTVDQLILKQKFSRLAHRDPLTNLFNRLMLSDNIEIALRNLQAE
ncbi:hypothetical protein [Bradyrhizobium sp. AZCC 2230]|uniref:hypothetical protein n=1 Tax=Bradyrhizobium sp. AZCC 2230 TaxID=3117021 RepID=UPI002FF1E0B2